MIRRPTFIEALNIRARFQGMCEVLKQAKVPVDHITATASLWLAATLSRNIGVGRQQFLEGCAVVYDQVVTAETRESEVGRG